MYKIILFLKNNSFYQLVMKSGRTKRQVNGYLGHHISTVIYYQQNVDKNQIVAVKFIIIYMYYIYMCDPRFILTIQLFYILFKKKKVICTIMIHFSQPLKLRKNVNYLYIQS